MGSNESFEGVRFLAGQLQQTLPMSSIRCPGLPNRRQVLVLSQSNSLAQILFGVMPWAIAIFLSKRYGDENLSDRPRPKWWPGVYPVEQREPLA